MCTMLSFITYWQFDHSLNIGGLYYTANLYYGISNVQHLELFERSLWLVYQNQSVDNWSGGWKQLWLLRREQVDGWFGDRHGWYKLEVWRNISQYIHYTYTYWNSFINHIIKYFVNVCLESSNISRLKDWIIQSKYLFVAQLDPEFPPEDFTPFPQKVWITEVASTIWVTRIF